MFITHLCILVSMLVQCVIFSCVVLWVYPFVFLSLLCLIIQVRNLAIPFLCIHGEDDLACLPAGTEYIMNHAGEGVNFMI